jgi:hypothetical protein
MPQAEELEEAEIGEAAQMTDDKSGDKAAQAGRFEFPNRGVQRA